MNKANIVDLYKRTLNDSTKINNKLQRDHLIISLRELALKDLSCSDEIVEAIRVHADIVDLDSKILIIDLIQSMVSSINGEYRGRFDKHIVDIFFSAYIHADRKTRAELFERRDKWDPYFSRKILRELDVTINRADADYLIVPKRPEQLAMHKEKVSLIRSIGELVKERDALFARMRQRQEVSDQGLKPQNTANQLVQNIAKPQPSEKNVSKADNLFGDVSSEESETEDETPAKNSQEDTKTTENVSKKDQPSDDEPSSDESSSNDSGEDESEDERPAKRFKEAKNFSENVSKADNLFDGVSLEESEAEDKSSVNTVRAETKKYPQSAIKPIPKPFRENIVPKVMPATEKLPQVPANDRKPDPVIAKPSHASVKSYRYRPKDMNFGAAPTANKVQIKRSISKPSNTVVNRPKNPVCQPNKSKPAPANLPDPLLNEKTLDEKRKKLREAEAKKRQLQTMENRKNYIEEDVDWSIFEVEPIPSNQCNFNTPLVW